MRVHNNLCRERLNNQFNTFWEELRRKRNVVIHSAVTSGDLIRPEQLIEQILTVHSNLHPGQRWFQRHLEHVPNDELETAFSSQPELIYANILEGHH